MRKLNEFVCRSHWRSLDVRRQRGPIRWDRDSDFGFIGEDLPHFLAAAKKLAGHDFVMRSPEVNNDGRTTRWALKCQGVKYQFFQFERHGGKVCWYDDRRQPDPDYVYWRDCAATIDRYPWSGERRAPD